MSESLEEDNITIEGDIGIKKIDEHIIYFDHKDKFLLNTLADYENSEKFVTGLVKKNVKKDMRAINIGANVGYYTLLLARQVGEKGFVYSFEPFLLTVKNLKTTIEKNGYKNVEIVPKAVTNKTGIEKMTISPSSMHCVVASIIHPNLKIIQTDVITLDDFFADKNPKVDFIFMDAEGSESYVLDGMKRIIDLNPKLEIVTEYNAFTLGLAGTKGEDFYEKIKSYGFYVFNIDESVHEVRPITKEELLTRYPDEGQGKTGLTNLYLTKDSNKNFNN